MMKKSIAGVVFFVCIGLLGLLLGGNPAWSQQTCPGPSPCTFLDSSVIAPTLPGRPARATTLVSCYATFFGEPLGCGNVIHKVLGLKEPTNDVVNNGGHQHSPETHPLTAPPPNDQLVFQNTGLLFDPKLGVSTGPVFGTAVILHQMPEASGNIVTETLVRAPLGWRCFLNCFDSLHGRTLTTLNVGIPNLVPLAGSGTFHLVVRTPASQASHPEGTFGTLRTLALLEALAQDYAALSSILFPGLSPKLSVNDISLPRGGMFDLNNQWFAQNTPGNGHVGHRTGTAADLNRAGVNGFQIQCDNTLRELVDTVIPEPPPGRPSALRCETGDRRHVDFE
jgi:hypothetical protein